MIFGSQAHIEKLGHWPYLTVSVSGPWDMELAKFHLSALVPTVACYDYRGPWAAIVMVSGAPVMTPNAFRLLRRFVLAEAARPTKRMAMALVCDPESEVRPIAEAELFSLYEGICPVALFDDLTTARTWVRRYVETAQISAA